MANTDIGNSLASLLQVPGLQELLNQAITQQRQAAPLRTAANQYAVNTLPSSAFGPSAPFGTGEIRPDIGGIPAANYNTPPPPPSSNTGSWLNPLLAGLAGFLGGRASNKANNNLGDLLNKLFHRGGGGGQQPWTGPLDPGNSWPTPLDQNTLPNYWAPTQPWMGPLDPGNSWPTPLDPSTLPGWSPTGQVDVGSPNNSWTTDPNTNYGINPDIQNSDFNFNPGELG